MRNILNIVFLLILTSCSAGLTQYSANTIDITQTDDKILVKQASLYRSLSKPIPENALMNRSGYKTEMNVILSELRRRHPEWNWQAITNEQIKVGMSDSEALLSWGPYSYVNSASYGKQWVYRRYNFIGRYYDTSYVYVQNGKVSGWN